ncbi:6-carboxytetrahydropterin synthase QueD [Dactylosporangium darangshiense]|uniref:6-carboxy-5,6,7,8-tetrahydropterin synthase n=3 Tax=Dactylosporangium darangshiense TaxID=579108 RepID=A0ABP8DID1_9ACTN
MTSTYMIGKSFGFSAAHRLPGLPKGHKCRRRHGHNFTAQVVLGADQLVPPGFVADFGDLDRFRRYLNRRLDHRDLNTVLDEPPTCENLARHLAAWFLEHMPAHLSDALVRITVSESDSSWAAYHVPGRRA